MGSGVGLDAGHLGVPRQRRVVVHQALGGQHPAVAVVGVLVQAQVGHQHQFVADLGAHVPQRDLEDPLRVGARRAHRVLLRLVRHAEEHQPADPRLDRLHGGLPQRVPGVLHDARHGAHRNRLARALPHESGQDQIGGPGGVLGDHTTHGRRAAQPPRTGGRIAAVRTGAAVNAHDVRALLLAGRFSLGRFTCSHPPRRPRHGAGPRSRPAPRPACAPTARAT